MKLVYHYMAIFFNFSPTSCHLRPLQVENCGSNSRLVVDEDDNGKFGFKRGKDHQPLYALLSVKIFHLKKYSAIFTRCT